MKIRPAVLELRKFIDGGPLLLGLTSDSIQKGFRDRTEERGFFAFYQRFLSTLN